MLSSCHIVRFKGGGEKLKQLGYMYCKLIILPAENSFSCTHLTARTANLEYSKELH